MCRRFTQHYTWSQIQELYGLVGAAQNVEPRYNIAPTTTIDVVVPSADGLHLASMRWGLVPTSWPKSLEEMKLATFNAGAENITKSPTFRSAFKSRRCLIPASGFYEWNTIEGKKQPVYISAIDGTVLTIAGCTKCG
jgi:putative SOS response-associated peptidase YedK